MDAGTIAAAPPFLSVVMPTYNRASDLERQLAWLHGELTALEVTWDVAVFDNCSTDETPEVLARWRERFGADRFRVVRHDHNIGGLPNLVASVEGSRGRWVWTVGDDDPIHDGTTQFVVDELRRQPDLSLFFLNFRGIKSGAVSREHYFEPSRCGRHEDGRQALMEHLDYEIGSVIFLTATIYRGDLAREAVASWHGRRDNWFVAAYLTGYAAARGPVYVDADVRIDCIVGVSQWQRASNAWRKACYRDIPAVCVALAAEGYPKPFCKRIGLRYLRGRSFGSHLKALWYCPGFLVVLPELLALGGQ
jgi:glycosyltransferase involved in cell wall biosynthesis